VARQSHIKQGDVVPRRTNPLLGYKDREGLENEVKCSGEQSLQTCWLNSNFGEFSKKKKERKKKKKEKKPFLELKYYEFKFNYRAILGTILGSCEICSTKEL